VYIAEVLVGDVDPLVQLPPFIEMSQTLLEFGVLILNHSGDVQKLMYLRQIFPAR
jgi:hypothetical protein